MPRKEQTQEFRWDVVKSFLTKNNRSEFWLCEQLKASYSSLMNWKRGMVPLPSRLAAIAKLMGVSSLYLLKGKKKP